MTDNRTATHFETSGTSPPVPDTSAASEGAQQPHAQHRYVHEGFQNRTKGERAFNLGTYVGVGYFGSLGATVLLTWFLRDSKIGWPKYQKFNDWFANATKGARSGEALDVYRKKVDSNMTILSMFTGTTLMSIFPIKWLEDRKASLIKKLDRKIYGDEAVANDPALREAHEQIDHSPKQTWASIGVSRGLAFGATMATSLAIGDNSSPLARSTGHSIDSISIRAGRWFDRVMHRGNPEVVRQIESVIAHSPKDIARADVPADRTASRLFNYLTLDGLYTVMTTSLLFIFTRVLAPVFDKNIQQEKRQEKTHPPHDHTVPQPLAAPDVAAPAADEAALPSAQVRAVQAQSRLSPHAPELTQGA